MKALLLHVGVDHTSDTHRTMGISGPIFENGTFQFIPILEQLRICGITEVLIAEETA